MLAALFVAIGCPAVPPPGERVAPDPASPSGPTAASGPAGTSGPTGPSGPASPVALPVAAVVARLGPSSVSLDAGNAAIDPGSTFEVRVAAPVRRARLVLLDAQDALVPSGSEAEMAVTTRFTLVPLEPLQAGSRYLLRIEGIESRLVPSLDGRSFEPVAVPFVTSGDPLPRAPPGKPGRKRPPG